jgi:hypothetical protein
MSEKRAWIKPQLIILGRGTPEERALAACKVLGTGGPGEPGINACSGMGGPCNAVAAS